MAKYAFCESSNAGSLAPWHIRPLTPRGKKLGGGIDTRSLCSRVSPSADNGVGGWDLEVEVESYGDLDAITDGRRHVCKTCVAVYRNNTGRNDRSSPVTFHSSPDARGERDE